MTKRKYVFLMTNLDKHFDSIVTKKLPPWAMIATSGSLYLVRSKLSGSLNYKRPLQAFILPFNLIE